MELELSVCILVLCLSAAVINADDLIYKDPKQPVEDRVEDLLGRMTLEEKIGQMTQIERKVATPNVMNKYFIGSVLSGGGSGPGPNASAEAWVNMVNEIQKGALSTRLRIPMIYGIDAVHGQNNVYNATIFPHNVGLGVTRDPDLVKRIGDATALEVRATGIPYAFAPGLQGDPPANYPQGFPFVSGKYESLAKCTKSSLVSQLSILRRTAHTSLGFLDTILPTSPGLIKPELARKQGTEAAVLINCGASITIIGDPISSFSFDDFEDGSFSSQFVTNCLFRLWDFK